MNTNSPGGLQVCSFWGPLLALIFLMFHNFPTTAPLQQLSSETLVCTSQILSLLQVFFQGSPFFIKFPMCYSKHDFEDPLRNPSGPEIASPIYPRGAKKYKKKSTSWCHFRSTLEESWNQPCSRIDSDWFVLFSFVTIWSVSGHDFAIGLYLNGFVESDVCYATSCK